MDEDLVESNLPTAGERLRAAREEKGLSLEDIAAQTRIPRRHLESIETGDWDALPAPTYTTGFAKSYASAVGLDRTEIGDQLRAEMGGQRFATSPTEVFEAADPRRTMPKWLVIGTIVAVVVLIAVMSWLNKRSLEQPAETGNTAVAQSSAAPTTPVTKAPAAPAAPAVQGRAVVLIATDAVWLQVSDKGTILYSAILQPGQTFTVPPSATAPVLKTGKPEALKIMVGNSVAPPVGRPATKVSNVSLLPQDLMRQSTAATTTTQPRTALQAPAATPAVAASRAPLAESGPTTNAQR